MVDEDSGDPPVGVELINLDLEPAHVAPKIDGHRVHASEGIEKIKFQVRRGRQRLRKVGAQRVLASHRSRRIPQHFRHQLDPGVLLS